jgi:hypothetical protein
MGPKSESCTLQEESCELPVFHVSGEFTSTALLAANAQSIADVVEELIARLSTPSGIKRSLKIPHLNLVTSIRQENLITLAEGSDRFKRTRQIPVLSLD